MKKIILMVTLALLVLTSSAFSKNNDCNKRLLYTSATAEVTGDNDSATVNVSIITQNRVLETANKQNTTKADAVKKALNKLGVQSLLIKTASYNVNPKRNYKKQPHEIVGYEINNTLALTIEGMDKEELSITVSKLLDTALKHGANQIGQTNFYIQNRSPLVDKALAKATDKAIAKAKILAKSAGVALGPLSELRSDPVQSIPLHLANVQHRGMFKASSAAPSTPIEAGESKISATVNIVYQMK